MLFSKSAAAAAILCVVLSALVLTQAARPMPTSETDQADAVGADQTDSCEGLGDQECLERRTLAAHVDYIYTQHRPKN